MSQANDVMDAGAPPARTSWVRWHIVALLIAYSFMTWFNRVSMSVAYNERIVNQFADPSTTQHAITEEQIGMVISAFLFAYMVCMTPGGWFIDRFGPRVALVIMGLGSALFGALTGLAGHPAVIAAGLVLPTLLVIRSVMGVFTAPVYPAASRIVAHWIPLQQCVRANGLVQGAAALGIACAFPVFGALIDWFDWPTAFVISGSVTGLVALVWTFYATDYPSQHRRVGPGEGRLIKGEEEPPAQHTVRSDWMALLRNRSLVLLTISYGAVGYFEYLFDFWMHYYFKDVLNLGKSDSRLYATILNLAMAAGMALGGLLSDRLQGRYGYRIGRSLVPVAGLIAGAALLGLGILAHETVWIVTFLALALAAVAASEAPIWTTSVEIGGRQGGTAAALCNTGGNLGGLVAPIVTPFVGNWVQSHYGVSKEVGWQWAIAVGCVVAFFGAALWWWIDPSQHCTDESDRRLLAEKAAELGPGR